MYIACHPPSPNVLGGETGAPGGNNPETAGCISFFSNKENAKFVCGNCGAALPAVHVNERDF